MRRIAVLFHENERHATGYVIHHLAELWREDGHAVEYLFGTHEFVPADVVVVHVDLSVVPDEYLEFAARYPRAVNGSLRDIRKSQISRNLVGPDDDWDGPVIVKANLNFFGRPERDLAGERSLQDRMLQRWPHLRRVHHVWNRLRPGGGIAAAAERYRIFDRIGEVPSGWFSSGDIVVEKFVPEIEDGLFYVRYFQVFGSRWRCHRLASRRRVIKAHHSIATRDAEPHDELFEWQREYHLDYGKIDYVVHEGRPILLDLNKTTGTSPGFRSPEERAASRRHLADGIRDFFD
jgi:hypothetical protein